MIARNSANASSENGGALGERFLQPDGLSNNEIATMRNASMPHRILDMYGLLFGCERVEPQTFNATTTVPRSVAHVSSERIFTNWISSDFTD